MTRTGAQAWTTNAAQIYLSEIGHYPLLTAQEEVELAIQYERGKTAQRQLAELALPDPSRRRQLEQTVQSGARARRRLIECNLRLVVSLTKRFRDWGLPFGDLVQEANIGLMKAVERYDYRRGVRLSTYAGWWIQQTVRRAVRRARVIPFPQGMHDELVRLRRARRALESRLGRSPTLRELADQVGAPAPRVRQMLKWDQEVLSLEMPIGDHQNSELADVIPDLETLPVEGAVVRQLLKKEMREAMIANLDPRDREVLSLRFGLDGGGERTLDQVAQVYGITRERARQLEKRALKRLRCTGELHGLRGS
jgi:RNA polymerase sigma factor (sigma-70 family)